MLEGLDGTGKTQVAKALYEMIPAPCAIFHAGPPILSTPIREYVWPLGIAAAGYVVICDRWHLGERVWPPLFERDSLIPDRDALRHIEEQISYLRTPILPLFLMRPMKDIVAELQARGDVVEHLPEANRAYSIAMAESSLNWRNTTMQKAPKLVKEWLDGQSG